MIVIEGPDAGGKSTLAKFLSEALSLRVQHSGGPEKYPGEMQERLAKYDNLPNDIIYDRHPCVSEEIYSYALRRPIAVTAQQVKTFYDRKPFLIYCEPPPRVMHVFKDHETIDHRLALSENAERVLTAYHSWAITHANVIYHIGDDMTRILHYVTDFIGDIENFHHRFGIAYTDQPRVLPSDLFEFRLLFMAEELCEYAGVSELTKKLIQSALKENCVGNGDLHEQFDGLIDLVYIALGTAHLHGFKFREGWTRVHRANMAKRRAASADESKRLHIADVIKPDGWVAPNLSDLIRSV